MQEVQLIMDNLSSRGNKIFSILYGSGLRITECLRLRVKDIDFQYGGITVNDGKDGKTGKLLLRHSIVSTT
jgi:integrase